MKKKLYYAMPFIVVPVLMLFCELLDNLELLKMNPYIIGTLLLLSSAVFGFLSPSDRNVDCLITAIMPISLFCFMFVVGFFSKCDLETRFHLNIAVDASFQPIALLLYFAMATVTILASIKSFRNLKNRCAQKNNVV